ncbi:non-heme chloroperoxidase [Bradyrhizobium sp. LA2.1]
MPIGNSIRAIPKSRRDVLVAAGGIAAAASLPKAASAANRSNNVTQGKETMTTVTAKDGTKIFYKDWGTGKPVVFSHGWPLTADAWDNQMLFLSAQGYRVIAHDRRGHGRSGQPSKGNDMDTYADDMAAMIEALDLKGVTLVGHSTGGGEVARYIGRHGTGRVAKAVLISSVPPHMLKTADNPEAAPMEVFDGLRAGMSSDRSTFFKGLAMPFFGFNRPNAKVSQGAIESFWMQGMLGGIKGQYECIKAFSETDFTNDLKKMTIPTLIIQGDDDQIVPIGIASLKSAKIVPKATLKIYPGAPHGLCVTLAEKINADLLEFLKS